MQITKVTNKYLVTMQCQNFAERAVLAIEVMVDEVCMVSKFMIVQGVRFSVVAYEEEMVHW